MQKAQSILLLVQLSAATSNGGCLQSKQKGKENRKMKMHVL
jgi:hypothetical protein